MKDTFFFTNYYISDSCLSVKSGLSATVNTSDSDSQADTSAGLDVDSDNGSKNTNSTDKEYCG